MDKQQWDAWLRSNGVMKGDNQARWVVAGSLHSKHIAELKELKKEHKSEITAKDAEIKELKRAKGELSARASQNNTLQYYIDNPLDAVQEHASAKAVLHMMLDTGDINPQLFDKLVSQIGMSTGEDEKIEVVDFSTAFPDMASAIASCHRKEGE